MKKITIRIAKGQTKLSLEGYKGEGCLDVVRSFGDGATPVELTPTAEYYEAEETESERAVI